MPISSSPQIQAKNIAIIYGVYCLGTTMIAMVSSTLAGALGGLLVVTGDDSNPRPQTIIPSTLTQACETVGTFIVKRSISCVKGGVYGAFEGAKDGVFFVTAPWARLFKTVTTLKPAPQKRVSSLPKKDATSTDLMAQKIDPNLKKEETDSPYANLAALYAKT